MKLKATARTAGSHKRDSKHLAKEELLIFRTVLENIGKNFVQGKNLRLIRLHSRVHCVWRFNLSRIVRTLYFALGLTALAVNLSLPVKASPFNQQQRRILIAQEEGGEGTDYERAASDCGRGDLNSAETILKSIISAQPNNAKAHNLLGKVYHRRSKFGLAEKQYRVATGLDGKVWEYKFNLAVSMFDQSNFHNALPLFEEVVRVRPNDSEYQYNLAVTLERLGRKDQALAGYLRALKLDNKNAHAHFSLGRLYHEKRNLPKAIEEYKSAIAIEPKFVAAHNNLGVAYAANNNFPDSVKEFQAALKLDPHYPEAQRNLGYPQAHTSLGITYFTMGNLKKAFEEYSKALSMDPDNGDAHYNLGLLYHHQGQLDKAIAHYQRAIEVMPNNPLPHNNLGVAFARTGDFPKAEVEYKKALELKPDFAEAKKNLEDMKTGASPVLNP